MTHRERFEAVLARRKPDRVPAVVRFDLWHRACVAEGRLPPQYEGCDVAEIERRLGFGRSARAGKVFRTEYDGASVETRREGDCEVLIHRTPLGELITVSRRTAANRRAGMGAHIVKYPIRTPADLRIAEAVFQSERFVPDYETFREYDREIGDEGLPLTILAACPAHRLMLKWFGYDGFYYALADDAKALRHLVTVMEERQRDMWDVVARSPARFVLHGTHFSSDMTPPPIFRVWFLAYFREFNDLMHASGKRVCCHADADLSLLLDLVAEAGFDMADCFACAPMVPLTFQRALEVWDGRVAVWGAVPSPLLEPDCPLEAFERHIDEALALAQGRCDVVFAISDNVMPTSDFSRVEWMAQRIA